MRVKRPLWLTFLILLLCLCLPVGAAVLYYAGRPLPFNLRQELFDGVTYYRQFHLFPRPYMVHVVAVDLDNPNVSLLVTPPDSEGDLPLKARTTSKFVDEFNVQIAVNGDGFTPWRDNGPRDYYPRPGDPVTPNGLAISRGRAYGGGTEETMYISAENRVTFNVNDGNAYNAISGDRFFVRDKAPLPGLPNDVPAPRTGVGLDVGQNRLIIVVVDGRQPLYSHGVTIKEFAEIMIYYGADIAMNLDGGGSSTLVMRDANGRAVVLNSPIHNGIPGRERPVGNHLGIFAAPLP